MTIEIQVRDPRDPDMMAILQTHLDFCMSSTPLEHVHALDVSKLTTPDITVFGGKLDGELVAVGAIRILDNNHAELKSMHTLSISRGNGLGRAIVKHIEEFAMSKGITRLSLETGTSEAFKPARNLYQSLGFQPCEAFGEYENTEDNICMTKLIASKASLAH
ncbi:MAG: GNAT family N-acetyltransferase [Candidatus Nanopelagicaceae bacterium]